MIEVGCSPEDAMSDAACETDEVPAPFSEPVIGPQVRRLNHLILRRMNEIFREGGVEDASAVYGWALRYLYVNRDKVIYQKNIEQVFGITRSAATGILQQMEKRNYIRREAVPHDARLKRIVLTETGEEYHHRIECCLTLLNENVDACLSGEEKEELLRLLLKLQGGLSQSGKSIKEGNPR